jgi:hypothetical protein
MPHRILSLTGDASRNLLKDRKLFDEGLIFHFHSEDNTTDMVSLRTDGTKAKDADTRKYCGSCIVWVNKYDRFTLAPAYGQDSPRQVQLRFLLERFKKNGAQLTFRYINDSMSRDYRVTVGSAKVAVYYDSFTNDILYLSLPEFYRTDEEAEYVALRTRDPPGTENLVLSTTLYTGQGVCHEPKEEHTHGGRKAGEYRAQLDRMEDTMERLEALMGDLQIRGLDKAGA